MPRKLLPYVERNRVKGKNYFYFRRGKGQRTRLPEDPNSQEFLEAYNMLLADQAPVRARFDHSRPGTIGALIISYRTGSVYPALKSNTRRAYAAALETLRRDHGHRSVKGMTKANIEEFILKPYADRPGAKLILIKVLRVLIHHAMSLTPPWLTANPSEGIKRPKTKEIRAWTDEEHAAMEAYWPLGTKQRTAYELMLNVGTARVDVRLLTWRQFENGIARYARQKTGVVVEFDQTERLQAALKAYREVARNHVTIINTAAGKPFTTGGFGNFMRDAIDAAGLPQACKPHGLRKSLGRRLADAGATAHEIMAVLGQKSLEEAERYTREANRRLAGRHAIEKLDRGQRSNSNAQTVSIGLGKSKKEKGNQSG